GGDTFFNNYKNRVNLTYVGADDGMLHAFFTRDTVLGGTTYVGGTEAFAYIPADMLPVLATLYEGGGQPADPEQHVYGLANSPKVKNLCIKNCTDPATADWRTLLVMGEGPGGNDMFTLDITNPIGATGINDPPVSQLWDSAGGADAGNY